ncbi:hypothetical protein BGZ65_011283 [Modicella reniformis]|uniref:Uncharacterized protein n=1 Tax=Modicella reniformis TaxID=1440133 RepID=A0A9P6MKA8_9FUNG|nr:hypothetical protein BGZ65_011283 [Modicella reniformis]
MQQPTSSSSSPSRPLPDGSTNNRTNNNNNNNNTGRPNSVIWAQLSKSSLEKGQNQSRIRSGLEQSKTTTSIVDDTSDTESLENSLFYPKGRKDSRSVSRRERIKKIMCNPTITESIPLAPRVLSNGTHEFDPTIIVLSLDGFRADYLERELTPNTLSIGTNGVWAEYMQPSFPTLTFPNHHTLVTGLYPSVHGIVGNMFYDSNFGEDFNNRFPAKSWDPKWWGGEPIWTTAVKQNQRSGVIMWPGGEVLSAVRPTYHVPYKTGTVLEKMDTVLNWIDKPREERPTVMAVYVPDIDSTSHDFGPDGKKNQKALVEVDTALGVLLEGLQARNLDKVVNLVVVSDHGMSYVNTSKCIYYDDFIDTSDLLFEESLYPHLAIWPKDSKKLNDIYHTIKRAQRRDTLPFQVYRRFVMTRRDMGVVMAGVHGWDNENEEMRAIFLARGPSFPNLGSKKLQSFENVEVHDIIARTVGLPVKDGATDGVRNGFVSKPC